MQTPEEFWNCLALCQYTSDRLALIAARDARLLDEAAERGVGWLKTLHHEPEEGLPWSGKIRRMQDLQVQTLRAAIKGGAHE